MSTSRSRFGQVEFAGQPGRPRPQPVPEIASRHTVGILGALGGATLSAFEPMDPVLGHLPDDLDLEDLVAPRLDALADQSGPAAFALRGLDVDDLVDLLLGQKFPVVAFVAGLGSLAGRFSEIQRHFLVLLVGLIPRVVGGGRTVGVRRILADLVLQILDVIAQAAVLVAKPFVLRLELFDPSFGFVESVEQGLPIGRQSVHDGSEGDAVGYCNEQAHCSRGAARSVPLARNEICTRNASSNERLSPITSAQRPGGG